MTAETKIRTKFVAEDSGLRSIEVSIGRSKIVTPSKSYKADLISLKNAFPIEGGQLNEIYKSYNPEKLEKLSVDPKAEQDENKKLQKLYNNKFDLPTASFVDFQPKDSGLLPSEKEIRMLANYAYTYSDITPIPSVSKYASIPNPESGEKIQEYIKQAVHEIELWNHKPIMGYLPFIGDKFIEDILRFYLEHGINSYYIDFNSKNLLSRPTTFRNIKAIIADAGYEENHFIHLINMDYGKMNKELNMLPAKDFLGFGYGFDSLGNAHGSAKGFGKKEGVHLEKKTRVFDRNGYGYYKLDSSSLQDAAIPYPDGAAFSREEIVQQPVKNQKELMMDMVNFEEQRKECLQLQSLVGENDRSIKYFESKPCLEQKDIKKMVREFSQSRLSRF